jgi:hypothetical protein
LLIISLDDNIIWLHCMFLSISYSPPSLCYLDRIVVMVFNATFNNISVIPWPSVLFWNIAESGVKTQKNLLKSIKCLSLLTLWLRTQLRRGILDTTYVIKFASTTDHGQATGKLYHLWLRVEFTLFAIYKAGREPTSYWR